VSSARPASSARSSTATCGGSGQACCRPAFTCNAGFICNNDITCEACGGMNSDGTGQKCCGTGAASTCNGPGLICAPGQPGERRCARCGADGQWCCGMNMGIINPPAGTCNNPTLECSGLTCRRPITCGRQGLPCCLTGTACEGALECKSNNICDYPCGDRDGDFCCGNPMTTCNHPTLACVQGVGYANGIRFCRACGDTGQPGCTDPSVPQCNGTRRLDPVTQRCMDPCGGAGETCCSSGLPCTGNLTCSGNTCQNCGNQDQACCNTNPYCKTQNPALTCWGNSTTGYTCRACGSAGQLSCGGACLPGLQPNTSNVCTQPCGMLNQRCCSTGSACFAGGACQYGMCLTFGACILDGVECPQGSGCCSGSYCANDGSTQRCRRLPPVITPPITSSAAPPPPPPASCNGNTIVNSTDVNACATIANCPAGQRCNGTVVTICTHRFCPWSWCPCVRWESDVSCSCGGPPCRSIVGAEMCALGSGCPVGQHCVFNIMSGSDCACRPITTD
jgi:hypothetical protein